MSVTWDPPGPGQWALDQSHAPAGCTPLVQELMRQTSPVAMRRVFAELGAPVETLSIEFVNGCLYSRLRPLIRPDKPSTKLPPLLLLRLAARVHPEMRRRARTATRVLAEEPWDAVIADWNAGGRAAIVAGNMELQSVPLQGCSDAELMAHVRACWENCVRNWQHHFWLHGYDLGPLGRYLFTGERWGLSAEQMLPLLQGASPSTSGPLREAAAIQALVAATGAEPATLTELCALSTPVAEAVERYLEHRRWVLVSRYDVDGFTLGERPDIVFATIMGARELASSDATDRHTATVRQLVPAAHRDEFDRLLASARSALDLRDDNGPVTAEWTVGLLRRALLEVGERLVAAGRVGDRNLVMELLPAEALGGDIAGLPDESVLRARLAIRQMQRTLAPPPLLGPAEVAPPLSVLPPALAEMVGTVQTVVRHMGMDGGTLSSGMHGAGIGNVSFTGIARVAASPEEALDRLAPGEVLVVACTTPAYNLVLSFAGAVVTSAGGPMSHAAVIARELGIPAVIGARRALSDIPNGALVEVDPVAGVVRVLSAP